MRAFKALPVAALFIAFSATPSHAYIIRPSYWTSGCRSTNDVALYVGWRRPEYKVTAYAVTSPNRKYGIDYVHFAWHPDGGREQVGFILREGGRKYDKHNVGGAARSRKKGIVTLTISTTTGRVYRCSTTPWASHFPVPNWIRNG